VSRRNRSDRDIEAQLRAARPEPTPEVTRAISDRVRPRRGLMGGLAHVPLGPVGGLTAIVAAVALALGGAGAALNVAGDSTNVRKAKTAKSTKKTQARQAPAINQYQEDEDVLICVYGYAEHTVSQETAATLVGLGIAEYGPCPSSIFNP
jgi:hypothetical protein